MFGSVRARPSGRGTDRRLPSAVWVAGALAFLSASADHYLVFLLLWIAAPQGWSGIDTAFVLLSLRLPTLAFGIVVGRGVDKWGARPMIILDVAGRGLLLLVLFLAGLSAGEVPLAPVLVLGGICGALAPANYAGVRWLVPRLVPPDKLGTANAVISLSDQLPLLVAAALVGPALSVLGPLFGLAVPVTLLGVALALARRLPTGQAREFLIPVDSDRARAGQSRPGRRSREGLRSRVTALIALSTVYYFVYGPFETASPAYVRSHLDAAEGTYSLLWTLFGLGAVATLPLAPLLARRRPGLVNAIGALAWGLVMLPLLVVDDAAAAAALFLLGGAIWGPYTTVETSALQRWVDPARHGAVFGMQRALLATATPLGAAGGALVLAPDSAHVLLAASAAGCAFAGLAALAHPGLRSSA
jgi:MFS family permease